VKINGIANLMRKVTLWTSSLPILRYFSLCCLTHSDVLYRFLCWLFFQRSVLSPTPTFICELMEGCNPPQSRAGHFCDQLWLAITPERIGQEIHWKHNWMRETAGNPVNLTKIHLDVWNYWEKSMYLCNCRTDLMAIFRENPKTRSPHPV